MNPNYRKREVITFRRFMRKGYALFAALGREVRIGVLSVATLSSTAPCMALSSGTCRLSLAQPSPADTLQLEDALVTASRTALQGAGIGAVQVHVLTKDDLASAGVTCVNDVLKLAAGVDVRQRGGFGMQTDISIEGGSFDQIALFVNGFPISNPQTGHNAADFPVNLSDIERIEVLEGAASRLFGAQAFSGAVNVVTRQPATAGAVSAEGEVAGGSYGTLLSEVRLASGRRFATSLSGSFRRSDGAVENGDFRGGKFFVHSRNEAADIHVDLQAGASLNDFGANTFYSAAYPNQWEGTQRYFLAARAETQGRVRLIPEVSWLRNVDHFQLIRHTHTAENFHRGDVYQGGARATTGWALGQTTVGAELRFEEIYSTNLGRPLDEGQQFRVRGQDSVRYGKHDPRTNLSFFLDHNVVLHRWTLSAGVLAQRNSSTGRHFRFYPGLDVAYRPGGGWRLFASWNRSLRLPTFTDLYYKSPTQEGNVGLRAEENSAFRLGADYRQAWLTATVKLFYNRGTNMIDWVMRSADDIYHATSFCLNNMGAGVGATLQLPALLGRRQPLRTISLSYTYIHQHREDDGAVVFKSNYALEYLRHKLVVRLDHQIAGPLSASWNLRLQHREGSYLVYAGGKATGESRPYGTHALLDVKLAWRRPHYEFYADLQNLTARRYYDLGSVRQPGFLLMAGARFRL